MYFTATDMDTGTDELEHYGVQGMKWGIRKYVNYDGSLTSEGKQKYGSLRNAMSSSRGVRNAVAKSNYRTDVRNARSTFKSGMHRAGGQKSLYRKVAGANLAAERYRTQRQTARLNREITRNGGKRVSSPTPYSSKSIKRDLLIGTQGYSGSARMIRDTQNGASKGRAYANEVGRRFVKTIIAASVTVGALSAVKYVSDHPELRGRINDGIKRIGQTPLRSTRWTTSGMAGKARDFASKFTGAAKNAADKAASAASKMGPGARYSEIYGNRIGGPSHRGGAAYRAAYNAANVARGAAGKARHTAENLSGYAKAYGGRAAREAGAKVNDARRWADEHVGAKTSMYNTIRRRRRH